MSKVTDNIEKLRNGFSSAPEAGSVPVADGNGQLDPRWIGNYGYVGIAYNIATDRFIRLGDAERYPVGQFPGPHISPVFQNIRRVTLDDGGNVTGGVNWLDFTKYDDGTSVPLDGSNGQIMVEYLPAYIRTEVIGDWYHLKISHSPLPGFELHPLFDGVAAAYQGAYEASVYNDGSGDKLWSIARSPADGTSDVYPVTTRAEVWGHSSLTTEATDALCEARGSGWQQVDFLTMQWERVLMLVGWAGYNFQSMVGMGRTELSGGDWLNGEYIGKCGLADSASGYSSAVQNGGTAGWGTDVSQVLGVENPWGNIWKRQAALVSDWDYYFKPLPPYDYSSTAGWTRLTDAAGIGVTLPNTNGYAGAPHSGLGMVLPADVSGSSSTKMADYFYQPSGLRVPLVGATATNDTHAGPFCVYASSSASVTSANLGGRLAYKKVT